MGFLSPWALLGLPLAAIPLWLAWRTHRVATPASFSSTYLIERARWDDRRRALSRSWWVQVVRAAVIVAVVLAAARPVGPGRGGPDAHFPTRAVVAVDVSASTAGRAGDGTAWSRIQAGADSVLMVATEEDDIALVAFADEIVGWWQARPSDLRRRLARLTPTARASDWPRALTALDRRLDDSTESYLFTDGAAGRRGPVAPTSSEPAAGTGHRVVRILPATAPNRRLAGAVHRPDGRVALVAEAWPADSSLSPVPVARWVGEAPVATRSVVADGRVSTASWAAPDTATFGFVGPDALDVDDRWYVATGGAPSYRVGRWTPGDEPAEPGTLFWESALATAKPGVEIARAGSLTEVLRDRPDVVLLPLRPYDAAEATLLAAATAAGTQLLFAPACPAAACIPQGEWLPASLGAPRLGWSLAPPSRRGSLAPDAGPDAGRRITLPAHLLARSPVRPAVVVHGGDPDWAWRLDTGEIALWVRGPIAVWLVPLGPPVTRLGTTPLFALAADAVLDVWDPRWREGSAGLLVGDVWRAPGDRTIVVGPLGARDPGRWELAPTGGTLRFERPGIYRVDRDITSFLAVNADPAEGDLTPIAPAAWETAWGATPIADAAWPAALFPRRRGPELAALFVVMALVGLAFEAFLRRRPRADNG